MWIDQGTAVNTVVPPNWWSSYYATPQERGVRYLDVDGDGKADIVHGLWDDVNSTSTQLLWRNIYAPSTYAWATTTASSTVVKAPSAYWKFDESSGNASDATGNGYALTNTGSTPVASALINNGPDFGASNNSMYFATSSNIGWTGTGSVSVGMWFKLRADISSGTWSLFQIDAASTKVGLFARYEYNGGARRLHIDRLTNGASDANIYYSTSLATTAWHHLVV